MPLSLSFLTFSFQKRQFFDDLEKHLFFVLIKWKKFHIKIERQSKVFLFPSTETESQVLFRARSEEKGRAFIS